MVTKGRQIVKKVIGKCVTCRKQDGKSFEAPPTAPLPTFRVSEAPPFTHIGVDFAGPLYVKSKDGMQKCYIVLFSCCVTRALHLELTEDLMASTFVNCFRKFCARRGTPTLMISDNAKTFKFTAKFLKKIHESKITTDLLESKQVVWNFNLERASWWVGHFERMVGSVKRCLRKVLGSAKLSYGELETVLFEVESTLNSRPLTYEPEELGVALTPSHLLYGRRLASLSLGVKIDADYDNCGKLAKRFNYLTCKLNDFWTRWKKEYLVGLRESHRMKNKQSECIAKGDIVLIQDENKKRGFWKMGIVENLIYGKDGHVRGAKIHQAGKGKSDTINRPLQKLFPLEIAGEKICIEGRKCEEGLLESEKNEKQEKKSGENSRSPGRTLPARAAAADARLRTRLMLDLI